MQIIRFSVWDNLFANFVNCRCILDIFLQIIELIVLDFFYRFCKLLFQTKFYCKQIPGSGDRLVTLANMVRVVGVVKVVRMIRVVRVLKKVEMSHPGLHESLQPCSRAARK